MATKHYLNGPKFREEMIKSRQQDVLTPVAIEMYMLLVKRISLKLYYKNPKDREDCQSHAYLKFLLYWKSYDSTKSDNAFSYFTQLAKNGMAEQFNRMYNKEMLFISIDEVGWNF